jgi:guanyl-specific ribonuclease Sa
VIYSRHRAPADAEEPTNTAAESRGARRVVIGSGGEDYYTSDHYATFEWIACSR